MKLTKTIESTTATIAIEGWLDTTTAPELEAALETLGRDVTSLVLDCEKLEYISSAGLRQIVLAYRRTKGQLKLIHVSGPVMEVFKMTGFDQKLDIQA